MSRNLLVGCYLVLESLPLNNMGKMINPYFRIDRSAAGFGLLELLIAVVLVALVSLCLSSNTVSSLYIAKKTHTNYLASNLALSKVEELAAFEPVNLDSSYNSFESGLSVVGTKITFSRTTTIVVNADDSRTITVKVLSETLKIPTKVDFTTTFAVWE